MVRALGSSRAIFVALLCVYLVIGVWTTRRVSATGDEPFYLMAADALVHGEGLDLTERFRSLADASYDPADPISQTEFDRSTAPSRSRGGSYPLHDLATSFVVALPLLLGGRALVVAVVASAMAAAVAFGHRTALALGTATRTAGVAALGIGLAAPALTYSGQVFPDSLAPLALAVGISALTGALPRAALGPAAAALVLLHLRVWPLALALLGAELVRRPRSVGTVARLVAPLAAAVAALSLIDLVVYGLPLPHAGFLLFFLDRPAVSVATFTRPTGEGFVGLFIDRSFGLVSAAPIAALLFAGAGRQSQDARDRALVLLPVPYLAVTALLDWTGGFSPQARYFAVLVPLFVIVLARALDWRPARVLAVPLAIWTLGQSAVYAVGPWLRYDVYGVAPLADQAWRRVTVVAPSALFPLLGTAGWTVVLALAWSAALALLFLAARRSVRTAVTPAS